MPKVDIYKKNYFILYVQLQEYRSKVRISLWCVKKILNAQLGTECATIIANVSYICCEYEVCYSYVSRMEMQNYCNYIINR